MKRMQALSLILLFILIGGCSTALYSTGIQETGESNDNDNTGEKKTQSLVITAVGDIMMHSTEIDAGYRPDTGDYDFSPFFEYVRPLFAASDLVIGNLETPLAGKKAGYSGYPRFNAPEILAQNLKDAGFDVLTTANNHCLDRGVAGLFSTLDYLDRAGLLHTGTSRSPEEMEKIVAIEKAGVKLAILSYTFSTNGINPPKDKPFVVNNLDEDRIKEDILKAKKEGADFIITCLHFGNEYEPYPHRWQEQIAHNILEAGADVILGHHPHVLQPGCFVATPTQDKRERKFIFYSLGNFISDQRGIERKSSVILNLYLKIDESTNTPYIEKVSCLPIWTRRYREANRTHFQVLPIEPALTSIMTGRTGIISPAEKTALEQAWQHVTEHLKSDDPDLELHRLTVPLEGLRFLNDVISSFFPNKMTPVFLEGLPGSSSSAAA